MTKRNLNYCYNKLNSKYTSAIPSIGFGIYHGGVNIIGYEVYYILLNLIEYYNPIVRFTTDLLTSLILCVIVLFTNGRTCCLAIT